MEKINIIITLLIFLDVQKKNRLILMIPMNFLLALKDIILIMGSVMKMNVLLKEGTI